MAIVEVKPIEKEKWHNKKGKDVFTRPTTIEALISTRTGQFSTGLSVEDRERLEKATGYNLSPDYMVGKPHDFWNSSAAQVKLAFKTNIFDTSKALDEIKVKLLKASDLVANSKKEYEEGKYPEALFVIFDEVEDTELRASKASIKRKVIIESSKLTKVRKAELIQILLGISVREQSEDFIDLKLDEAIESEGSEKVLNLIQRDKARVGLHSLILEALYKNILRKDGTSIYFMDDQLGFDIESTIDYFINPKNQTLKAQVLEKISLN
jgi:hypothetical protein